MSDAFETYFYDEQITNYILQFMAIFSMMQVEMGANADVGRDEPYLVPVPIAYGSKDRVVAWIKGEQTQNKPVRLPMLAVNILNYDLAPERRKGIGTVRRRTFMEQGGVFPDDLKVIRQRMPTHWKLSFELAIFASNQDQHFQILEQIMQIFDPTLQIQTSDEPFDWTAITSVELVGLRNEENYPQATGRRIIQHSLDFDVFIQISIPADIRDEIIRQVKVRVAALSKANCPSLSVSSSNLSTIIEDNVIFFDEIFNEDDLEIDDPLAPEPEPDPVD